MQISEVSGAEYALIVGNYNAYNTKEADLVGRGYSEAALAELRKHKSLSFGQSLNLKFYRPFSEFRYPLMDYVATLFHSYTEHGVLPYPGCHADQPAKIIEIFSILKSLYAETEREVAKAQEKKNRYGKS